MKKITGYVVHYRSRPSRQAGETDIEEGSHRRRTLTEAMEHAENLFRMQYDVRIERLRE